MNYKSLFKAMALAFTLTACGNQHKTETVVNDFLAENMKQTDYKIEFSDIDSTALVSDSAIIRMRMTALGNNMYRQPLRYKDAIRNDKYIFTQARIYIGNDTISQTFYLDMQMTGVVAFKKNG
ncbi:MAG: hypothetical protein ACI4V5_02555 [Prevotella sp.]